MKRSIRNIAAALVLAIPLMASWFIGQPDKPIRLTIAPGATASQSSGNKASLQAPTSVSVLKSACYAVSKAVSNNTDTLQKLNMGKLTLPIHSLTRYLIMVDLTAQRVGIYNGNQGNWHLVKFYVCSSGARGSQTPTGKFRIQSRGTWFYNSSVKEGARWWTGFNGNYLFHTLPMDINKKVLCSTLGKPLSHGCVRLAIDDAKWLYDSVPYNSTVLIYQ